MAEQVTSLDADLQALRQSKYSTQLAEQAKTWIFKDVLKESQVPSEDLISTLKSGVVLGRVANQIQPDSVKYKDSKMPFVQMENISLFLQFAKRYGVPEDELFQTVDLFEERDIASVLQTIISFSRYTNEKNPQIPVIGPKLSKKQPPVPKKPSHLNGPQWSSLEYGYINGATQTTQGVIFGRKRDITNNKKYPELK